MKIFSTFVGAVLLICLTAAAFTAYLYFDFVKKPASHELKTVVYEIQSGDSFQKIAQDLEEQGLVRNAQFFNIYARLKHARGKVKAGEYELNTRMSPSQVIAVITSGKSLSRPITISEGLNIYEIAVLVESKGLGTANDFLKLVRNRELIESLLGPEAKTEKIRSLEGYLFPETYLMTKYMKASDLVIQMTKRFLSVWTETQAKYPNPRLKLTRQQRVTLASLIEKETGVSKERRLISSVFHNRMDKGMKLQTDPSILYGLSELQGKTVMAISKADILRPTVYNTYVIQGLPPGPVSNPGREALEAAFDPAQSDYLFFVSQNDGTSVSTSTYKQHQEAVQRFQVDPKAREGKSWRDLKKKAN